MLTFAFWTLAIVSALSMLACLTWLLWLRARNTMKAAGNVTRIVASHLDQKPSAEDLIERGSVTLPREVDAFEGTEASAALRQERMRIQRERADRKGAQRAQTYQRWSTYFS